MASSKQFGVIGLGRMGGNLVLQALEKGMQVIGFTRHDAKPEFLEAGMVEIRDYTAFKDKLNPPRAVFLDVPAGTLVDALVDELANQLEAGDILIDGGNSYWGDSVRRYRRLKEKGIHFIDLGTSGGINGARHGACFMAGGDSDAIALIEPILQNLATPEGYVRAGASGAGHFTKLVHNGIEFGMLQAIAEGMDLLHHYREPLDIAAVLHCWRHGSVIRSWLIDLMEKTYQSEGGTANIPDYVEDTGEVDWLVSDAVRMEVAIPVIANR